MTTNSLPPKPEAPPTFQFSAFDIVLFIAGILLVYGIYNTVLLTSLKKQPIYYYKVVKDKNHNASILVYHNDTIPFGTLKVPTKMKTELTDGTKSIFINKHPNFLFWLFSVSLMNALAIVLMWPILLNIWHGYLWLPPQNQKQIKILLSAGILFSLVFYVLLKEMSDDYVATTPILAESFNCLYAEHSKLILGFFVSMPSKITGILGIVGISVLILLVGSLPWESPEAQKNSAQKLAQLREQFRLYVYLISGLILMGSITNGLIREVMLSLLGKELLEPLYPAALVWAYGVMFSMVLAIVYFPAFFYFEYQSKRIPAEARIGYESQKERTWNTVKIILAALAPLLGTVAQEFLKLISQL